MDDDVSLDSRKVLEIQFADGIQNVSVVKWEIALCLLAIFIIVYFSLWKGIKTSGKVRQLLMFYIHTGFPPLFNNWTSYKNKKVVWISKM